MRRAVFLDRDGTINVEKNHLYKVEDWEWISGAIEAIKGFNSLRLLVIVVSNQSGIARGLYTASQVKYLHSYVNRLLYENGAQIDAFYFCRHHPDFGQKKDCMNRKPNPGLIIQAQRDFNLDLKNSFMVGDKYSDILAGKIAEVRSILVKTGHGMEELSSIYDKNIVVAEDIYEAYKIIAEIINKENNNFRM